MSEGGIRGRKRQPQTERDRRTERGMLKEGEREREREIREVLWRKCTDVWGNHLDRNTTTCPPSQ